MFLYLINLLKKGVIRMAIIKKKAGRPKGVKNKEVKVKRPYNKKQPESVVKGRQENKATYQPKRWVEGQLTTSKLASKWKEMTGTINDPVKTSKMGRPKGKQEAKPINIILDPGQLKYRTRVQIPNTDPNDPSSWVERDVPVKTSKYAFGNAPFIGDDGIPRYDPDYETFEREISDAIQAPEPKINKARDIGEGSGTPLFKKGESPRSAGRPKGSKNKITVALQQIGEDNAQAVYSKLVEVALAGDVNACKMILDRVYPLRKGLRFSIEFDGPLDTVEDINALSKHVLNMVISGELSPEEAEEYGKVLEQRMKIITDTETMKKIDHTCMLVDMMKRGK
jgi:hypothetical protein